MPAAAHRRPSSLSSLYRSAFVSGASTGLGKAFAQMLLAEGVDVWGSARDVARLWDVDTISENAGNASNAESAPNEDAAKTENARFAACAVSGEVEGGTETQGDYPRGGFGKFTPLALDLADGAAAEQIFRAAAVQAGGFDIVINNAGYSVFGDFAATDFSHWQKQIEVMLVNTARLAHAALGDWRARDAAGKPPRSRALVNVSSLAAEFPLPYQTSYNIVKAGLTALSESLMIESAGTSVSVIDLRPGDYRTDFGRSVLYPNEEPSADVFPTETRQIKQPAAATETRQKKGSLTPRQIERLQTAKTAFERMMQSGPPPAHAAHELRRALWRRRSATLRCGRFFQAVLAPFLARFGSLALKRRVQARYFDV